MRLYEMGSGFGRGEFTFTGKTVILCGVPASGKSTIAGESGLPVFSADDFFSRDGVYRFDSARLPEAHGWCLTRFVEHLQGPNGGNGCVIDNTNCTIAEVSPYVALANAYGSRPVLVIVDTPPHVAESRNAKRVGDKRVPGHVIGAMSERLGKLKAELPPWFTAYSAKRCQDNSAWDYHLTRL